MRRSFVASVAINIDIEERASIRDFYIFHYYIERYSLFLCPMFSIMEKFISRIILEPISTFDPSVWCASSFTGETTWHNKPL